MKKKITILFYGAHLSYSPTIIGLYDRLEKHFDVSVVAESPAEFDNQPLTNRRVVYKPRLPGKKQLKLLSAVYSLRAAFDGEIAQLKRMGLKAHVTRDFLFVREFLASEKPDILLAVDFQNLLYAQVLGKRAQFISLEIPAEDEFYGHCDFENINSVVIQTRERYEHLFAGREFKTFFVQNAPVYAAPPAPEQNRRNLIYCGTAFDQFGFYHCLEFLRAYPEHVMHVKGALLEADRKKVETEYADLLAGGQLVFDSEYLDDPAVVDYLRRFRAGFCFYNFALPQIDTFNYYSAPSGKMFKYMAAGVPVIGQDILGLQPVKEFDCGVLIKDLEPASIKKAVDEVEADFERFSRNCLQAAAHYSFDKTVQPFIDYLADKS